MKNDIRFYREYGNWYADVPVHTKEENLMVGGVEKILDSIFYYCPWVNGNCAFPELTLTVSDDIEDGDKILLHLKRYAHNGFGANYYLCSTDFMFYSKIAEDKCWLCNVVHTVYGEHPKDIYITAVNHESD